VLEAQRDAANRDVHLFNNIVSRNPGAIIPGYDDWVFTQVPAVPTDADLLVFYSTKIGGFATQALADNAAVDFYEKHGASADIPPTTLTAPGRNVGGIYFQASGLYGAWHKATTAKRLLYIATYYP